MQIYGLNYKNTKSRQRSLSDDFQRHIFVDNQTPATITVSMCWPIDHLYGQKLEISHVNTAHLILDGMQRCKQDSNGYTVIED